jgi:hypothetical protein
MVDIEFQKTIAGQNVLDRILQLAEADLKKGNVVQLFKYVRIINAEISQKWKGKDDPDDPSYQSYWEYGFD